MIASLQRLAARCYELERLLRRADEPRRPDDPKKAAKKIGSPSEFDPQVLRGLSMDEVRTCIPEDWRHEPSTSGGGTYS